MFEHSETFGKYTLEERLAVGGMAEIYKAKTRGLSGFERVVAIKRLHRHLGQDEELVQMLIDEARLAVQLIHANIGQVFDLGCIDGQYFIVMEYIPGIDIHKVLRRMREQSRTIPIPIILHVVSEMLAGLDYAHNKVGPDGHPLQLVHRDISPQNIMFSTTGDIKLVDFGIAKARMQVMQTQAGIIKGKFYYMSPEQAHGRTLDRRSDIYAAGMVLYEMITGRPAYDETGDVALLRRVRACDFPPPSHWRRELDPNLEKLIMRALHKDRRQRHQTARDLQQDLVRYANAHFKPITKFQAAEFIRSVIDPSARPSGDPGRDLLRREDYGGVEDSIIYDASHLAVTEHSGFTPFAEGNFAEPDGPEHNPFADADEPTYVFMKEEDNPFAIPDEIEPVDDPTQPRRWGELLRSAPLLGGADDDFAGPDDKTSVAGLAFEPEPVAAGPVYHRHQPPPELGPREATMQTAVTNPVLGALSRGHASASRAATSRGGTDTTPAAHASGVAGRIDELFEPENRSRLLTIVGVMLIVVVAGSIFLLDRGSRAQVAPVPPPPDDAAVSAKAVHESVPALAKLTVTSSPLEAEIFLDGALVGKTPMTLMTVHVGERYKIKLAKDGYAEWEQEVLIPSARPEPLEVELEEITSKGVIKVVTNPPGARIELDGTRVGKSPITLEELDTRRPHTLLAFYGEGDDEKIERETVAWGQGDDLTKEVTFDFEKKVADAALPELPDEKKTSRRKKNTRRRKKRRNRRNRRPKKRTASTSSGSSDSGALNVWGGGGAKKSKNSGGSSSDSGGAEDLNVWGGSSSKKASVGYLTVKVIDGSGKVYIDGKLASSKTPLRRYSLSKGRHKVKVYFPMLKRYSSERTVEVRPGKTRTVTFRP